MKNTFIIGIAGGTASGKSTFTRRLKERFKKSVVVLHHDDYYRDQTEIAPEERKKINYDHPDSLDTELLLSHLAMLREGKAISGLLGGLGGIVYITAGVSEWKFENGVAGFGFLALAVMIFGQWKPVNIALAALLFGLLRALSNVYTGFHGLVALGLPSTLYNMLPYIISLLVLAIASTNSRAPKAEGIPYDKEQR